MSFSGQSNVPWQRSVMPGHSTSSTFHQGPPQMFMQQTPQQANMSAFGHGGMQSAAMFPATGGGSVSYPQPRTGLNPVAFQQGQGAGGGQSHTQHYNSIGTVTKISNDCGLVNDDVFFYRNVCKGQEPKLGDRVLFEATFATSGQFKWNATRVQLMQQPSHPPQALMTSGKGSLGYNSVPPPNEYQRAAQMMRHNSPKRSSPGAGAGPGRSDKHGRHERDRRDRDRDTHHRSRDRDEEEHDRKRRREEHDRSRERCTNVVNNRGSTFVAARPDRERDRERERERERERVDMARSRDRVDHVDRERERTRERDAHRSAMKGHRARSIRRYMVQIPKTSLVYKSADLQELRRRFTTLYIPSDFFYANIKWSEHFTPDNAYSLRRACQFHIMHKIVEPLCEQKRELLDPPDADYLYSAKVMLMTLPPIAEIYQKCFEEDDSESEQHVHPSRLISFLVGVRGRNEPMAIGGPWSPSLDGANPDKDPTVLIRTAIRTCKALTGIDLSQCTQWYRFVELYYHRTEYKNMEKNGPPRVETVVIYLPDVHSCMPSIDEWQTLTQVYKAAVENVIVRKSAASNKAGAAAAAAAGDGSSGLAGEDSNAATTSTENTTLADSGAAERDGDHSADVESEGAIATAHYGNDEAATKDAAHEDGDGDDLENQKGERTVKPPTHYSNLDLKTMKVQEIRDELVARNLPEKGVRNVIMARLAKAINAERANDLDSRKGNQDKVEGTAVADDDSQSAGQQGKPDAPEHHNEENENDDNDKNLENDEQDEWADVIDVDMSDIVILDEYDSSKNPEDNPPKEIDEKEKTQLIRRYTLPNDPHIVVHPNKDAKGGKFDCSIMSLSVLLDYHPEDTKERFFEVSLFAELFNEMLMRDFGFNIYKEVYLYKDTNGTTEEGSDANNATASKKDDTSNVLEQQDDNYKDSKESSENKSNVEAPCSEKSSREFEDDSQSSKSLTETRKRKLSTSASAKDKEPNAVEKKMVVVKPELLLSFIYFDTSHCGYIFEKDLEDLFAILGLNLSRSQIRKILGKLATRQTFYYRKLTDKEETPDATPTIEDIGDLSSDELKEIAAGNWNFKAVFGNRFDGEVTPSEAGPVDGLINYNGAVVHVGKLVDQIKRSEKSYSDLEKLYNDLRKQHTELQKEHTKSSGKIKDLQSEVKSLSRKLSDTNQDLSSLNRKYRDQQSTLSYIYNRVSPYFNREKDKEHKSESSRDKDVERDKVKENKDKEKPSKEKDVPKDDEKLKKSGEKESDPKADSKSVEKEPKKVDTETAKNKEPTKSI